MAFTLQDYTDIREMGRGGMGKVYLATQTSLNRTVVIKEMVSTLVADASQVKRFENEAKSAAALDHPNIIRIYDFGPDRDSFYIAMEYVDGPDLEQLFARQDIPMEVRLMIVLQALKGLHHAHQQNIIHRDVKPGNILVATNGQAKVLDFGLAYAGSQVIHLTATEAIVGTPQYMSPEQANGSDVKDLRMDVFSAAVVLYRTLAGRLPFAGNTIPTVLYNITQSQEQHIQTIVPTVPDDMAAALHQALAKDPLQRLPNLAPLIEVIQKFFFEAGFADPVETVHRCMTDPMSGAAEVYRKLLDYHLRMARHWAAKGVGDKVKAHVREVIRYDPGNGEAAELARGVAGGTTVMRLFRKKQLSPEAALLARQRPRHPVRAAVLWLVLLAVIGGAGWVGYGLWRGRGAGWRAALAQVLARAEVSVLPAPPAPAPATPAPQPQPEPPETAATVAPVRAAPQEHRTSVGTLKLHLVPAEATVDLDGRALRGSGAAREARLAAGRHRLEVSAEGYEPYGRWFTVERGVEQVIDVALDVQVSVGTLHVHTYPYGELWVDGRYKGNTPTNPPLELPAGRHSVAVHRPGYRSYEALVEVKAGERQAINVKLEADSPPVQERK